jgi:hypothetical protein
MSTDIVEGNHHDAFDLKPQLQCAFKSLKRLGLDIQGAKYLDDDLMPKQGEIMCYPKLDRR